MGLSDYQHPYMEISYAFNIIPSGEWIMQLGPPHAVFKPGFHWTFIWELYESHNISL